jgi:putative heme-binding domain-containing protein
VVLIAGPLDAGHPRGTHEYEKSVRLLAHCLEHAANLRSVRTEAHLGGWPDDPRTLDDADTIVLIASGSDRREQDHPFLVGDRRGVIERQMKRGCGLVLIHWCTFAPKEKLGGKLLEWVGGYFDYESGPPPQGWYSRIQVAATTARPASPRHPICRGMASFPLREEYYYHVRFRERDPRLVPVLTTPIPGEHDDQIVAWAVERTGGGRGFGFTGGHFFDNWKSDDFRRMVLNAIVWTAHADVPEGGVKAAMPTDEEIDRVPVRRPLSAAPLVPGRFGKALDARRGPAEVAYRAVYQQPPLTVSCWAKLESAAGYNLLVANNYKSSNTHWEIFTMPGSGHFTAYLPGKKPDHVHSEAKICDGKWHHLALVYEEERARLYVDARLVADQRIAAGAGTTREGPLWFGAYEPPQLGCDGLVDEVHLRRGSHPPSAVPDQPAVAGEDTLGLWHLDTADGGKSPDASRNKSPALLAPVPRPAPPPTPAGPSSPTELDYAPADSRLKAILIDRSTDESYVAIKVDTEGRLFVGGREGLFVFGPTATGGYTRHLLYRFPPDSWVTGIEARGNDLYVLTAAALYVIPEGRKQRSGLRPRRLLWGLPLDLHVSFHCLAWGPEGDLYLNHGDPLLNYGDFSRPDHWGHWALYHLPAGATTPYTGSGAVLRIRPDGSSVRVVARGLRGPFGLAFDHNWELFTNDNDHESMPHLYTPARLLHVTPHAEFFWPRGWTVSRSPERSDLLETMLEAPSRGVPVGMTYYDDPFLPSEYRHNLLQDRWDRLTITRHPLGQRGASYRTQDLPFLTGRIHARPVGVAVGRGGRVFATISYMAGNEASPHYVSDLVMITHTDDRPEAPFEPYDVTTAPAEKLWEELSSPAWSRRLEAHTELLRRGGAMLTEGARRLSRVRDNDPALLHLPWLATASRTESVERALQSLVRHHRPEVRLQAVRALALFPVSAASTKTIRAALRDPDNRILLAALAVSLDRGDPLPQEDIAALAGSKDSYVRQTAAVLLSRRATASELRQLARSTDERTRLGAVLAAGLRLTVPLADHFPPPELPLTYPAESAFFKLKMRFADAEVDLRTLGRGGSFSIAEEWKAVKHSADQEDLFDLLQQHLKGSADPVRAQAAYFLWVLRDPRSEPAVSQTMRELREGGVGKLPPRPVPRAWIVGPFPASNTVTPESGAIDLEATYRTPAGNVSWQETGGKDGFSLFPKLPDAGPAAYLFFQFHASSRQPVLLTTTARAAVKVWHNGRAIGAAGGTDGAATVLLEVQPGSNDVLLRAPASGPVTLRYRARDEVTASLPEKVGFGALARRLKEAAAGSGGVPAAFLGVDWQVEVRKGNHEQGRKLFGGLGCVKCHAITADQVGGGAPSLTEAGKRFTLPYLVESILLPSQQVAEPFRATLITTRQGVTLTGLVISETADQVELLLPDTTRKAVPKKDIEERQQSKNSPMPAGLVKSPEELRDLLAYLLSDHPLPP